MLGTKVKITHIRCGCGHTRETHFFRRTVGLTNCKNCDCGQYVPPNSGTVLVTNISPLKPGATSSRGPGRELCEEDYDE